MTADCLAQLHALLAQLDRATDIDEVGCLCKDLLKMGRRWPDEVLEEDDEAFERLSKLLMKFADSQQQDIVAAFRPLQEDVRQRMADTTQALNNWLSEVPHPEKASPQRLAEVLQAIEDAPQMRWYKQCADLDVKAQFLVAVASVVRAVAGPAAPLRSRAGGHPQALALLQRLTERFFVIPEHGNILDAWHDGRLEFYNATLWHAAKRAADRLKDDLQVRLVSALRRATTPMPVPTGSKAKQQLQLELHQWPMVSCPLARAFLDFVAQRGPELGDLGQPVLSECPPHSLLPSTLRKLLGRLDAFEVLDDDGAPTNADLGPEKLGCERLGVVRLRWEAVAALAFKAVGTKPKASSLAAPTGVSQGGGKPEASGVGVGGPKTAGLSSARSPGGRQDGADGDADGASVAALQKPALRRIDWSNSQALQRLVRRGLRAGDEDWRQAWHHFCKQRRVPADAAGLVQSAPPREVLAEFIERNLQALLKKEWAKDLVYRQVADVSGADSEREMSAGADDVLDASGAAKAKGKDLSAAAALAAAAGAAAVAARRHGREEEGSSSASESSRSKQRKRRKRDKRKAGMMGYNDYFPRRQNDIHISPEVMMMNMNQMMGMSMMMNTPLAMMGMGAPMLPHQMSMLPGSGGMKLKKDEKGKREKPEEKAKKSPGMDTRPEGRKEKAEQAPAGTAAVAAGAAGAAGAGPSKAMIDADDL